MTVFQRIVITGASGGIGRALAIRLAAPGVEMLLTGRDPQRLEAAAVDARSCGADARTAVFDLSDRDQLEAAIGRFARSGGVDLLICNAGVTVGLRPGGAPEDPEAVRRLFDVNYQAAVDAVGIVLPGMRERRSGVIALMSSLAALRPQADLPSYSASKAALAAYGEALRGWLSPEGIRVCVIRPGFVTSPMSARHHGLKLFEISAERAADRIVRGLERGRFLLSFPWSLAALAWIDARLLPPRLSDRFNRAFRAEISPDERL